MMVLVKRPGSNKFEIENGTQISVNKARTIYSFPCADQIVDEKYRNKSFDTSNLVIVALHDFVSQAFATANIHEVSRYIEVDVVCSRPDALPGAGSALMSKLCDIASENNFNMTLHALPHVVGYYERYGFRPIQKCPDGIENVTGISQTHDTNPLDLFRKAGKWGELMAYAKSKGTIFQSPDNAYDDPRWVSYLALLDLAGLADATTTPKHMRDDKVRANCLSFASAIVNSINPNAVKHYATANCGGDGYILWRCASSSKPAFTTTLPAFTTTPLLKRKRSTKRPLSNKRLRSKR
ncbi:hypothetical protein HDU93_007194 [Gonapodya sp. JEL0774]|nr:hypothetical protein HDU93_007194 [Gonapodya sp. JEL0774]